jgi:hypothetical protein
MDFFRLAMPLLPPFDNKIHASQPPDPPETAIRLMPRSPTLYAGRTMLVNTAEDAQVLAELALQRPLGWVVLVLADAGRCMSG